MFVALLLAALWAPASSHVHLERLGLIHAAHGEQHHHDHVGDGDADDHGDSQSSDDEQRTGGHDAADGNLVQASADTSLHAPTVSPLPCAPLLGLVGMASPGIVPSAPDRSGLEPPGVAPPEMSQRWHFASRAARPVRAPSSVS